MKLHRSLLEQVSRDVYRQFYSLNFRRHSPMRHALVKYRRKCGEAWAVWLADGDRVLAWSLVTPGRLTGQMRASFYVRKQERRKGLGKRLVKGVEALCSELGKQWGYFDHDEQASAFFEASVYDCKRAFSVYQTPGLFPYYYPNGKFAYWGDRHGNVLALQE